MNQTKKIAIITENFISVWRPSDIKSFLGGCQECVVSIADAFSRQNHFVHVFLHGPTKSETEKYNSVEYKDFSLFSVSDNYNTIILFKINPLPEDERLNNANVIFWSSDVQTTVQPNRYIKKYVCLSQYHKNRNGWPTAYVFPHGIDITSLLHNNQDKDSMTMLYCSSPDRGLPKLIEEWLHLKSFCPDMKLFITYGFKITKQIMGKTFDVVREDEEALIKLCAVHNIDYLSDISKDELEKLYWKCQYWVLPLANPDSELFCLSAIKAQFCKCTPVIYKKGALTETVGDYIDFDDFIRGDTTLRKAENRPPVYSWDDVVEKFWKEII